MKSLDDVLEDIQTILDENSPLPDDDVVRGAPTLRTRPTHPTLEEVPTYPLYPPSENFPPPIFRPTISWESVGHQDGEDFQIPLTNWRSANPPNGTVLAVDDIVEMLMECLDPEVMVGRWWVRFKNCAGIILAGEVRIESYYNHPEVGYRIKGHGLLLTAIRCACERAVSNQIRSGA